MWKELINGYNEGGRAGNRTFILKKILLKKIPLLAALLDTIPIIVKMPHGAHPRSHFFFVRRLRTW